MFPASYFAPRYNSVRFFPYTAPAGGGPFPGYFYKQQCTIYISKGTEGTATTNNTVQLSVKDFSYNKISNTELISKNTIDATQERVVTPIINTVSPVNFTFTTYITPVLGDTVTSPEEFLWAGLLGSDTITNDSNTAIIDFADGNVRELQNLTLWFRDTLRTENNFRLRNVIVDRATINFDIKGIGEINWEGRALSIIEDNNGPPAFTDRSQNTNCLKNKLSIISIDLNNSTYTLPLTGGSITIDNNNTIYGRSKLGRTTVPEGHYTGNRVVSGDLNFYMKSGDKQSSDLYNTLLSNASNKDYEINFLATITINIGGTSNSNLQIDIPQALFGIGRLDFNEIISTSIPFVAKEETGNYSSVTYNI